MADPSKQNAFKALFQALIHPRHHWFRMAVLCLLGLLVLTSPYTAVLSEAFDQQEIVQKNTQYLAQLEKESRDAILVLGALKGFYETLASSQIGINFVIDTQLTVGQVFAPFIDKIDDASDLFSISYGTSYLLKLINNHSDDLAWLLAVLLLSIGALYCALRYIKDRWSLHPVGMPVIARIGRYLFCHFLFFYLVVPYTIHGMALVSHHYTHELKSALHQDIRNLHDDAVPATPHESLSKRAEYVIKKFSHLEGKVKSIIDIVSRYLVQHWVLWIIELIPLLLLPLGYLWLVRSQFDRITWKSAGSGRRTD